MPQISRRSFIAGSATTAAAMAATGAAEAVALPGAAAAAATATIADVQHIVIFMQENRSFDHYFGTLQGVRGFADRTAITLPGGNSVFCQPAGSGSQYPWQLSQDSFLGEDRGQCNGSLDHSWPTQHQAFNGGAMDGWVAAKGSDRTVGYLSRSDIGYHYDLADAYTICDAYHCSVLSATGPNRTYLFSGWIDPNEAAGGPAYDNGSEAGLTWQTYAETLQEAGLSWKVYQSYDNYGDNALEFFRQFQDLAPDAPLYPGVEQVPGSSSGSGDIARLIAGGITADLEAGTFPQVSWIVTNQAYSEHPYAAPNDGAHAINLVLNALAAHPDVLSSTVVFLNYDENDGLFDHVPPPIPEPGTPDEYIPSASPVVKNLPIGLGFRVPMTIISPWTRGGKVFSEVSDHTSVIQFIERWSVAIGKPAICPNISAWRRSVCSDLTGAFDFASPVTGLASSIPPASSTASTYGMTFCAIMLNPSPATNSLPAQEAGTRTALALPYQPTADITGFGASATSDIAASVELASAGHWATSGAHFWIFANSGNPAGPWPYTVPAGEPRTVTVDIGRGLGAGAYNLTVIGPNRFRRDFRGNATTAGRSAGCAVSVSERPQVPSAGLVLALANSGSAAVTFTIAASHYVTYSATRTVAAGASWSADLTSSLAASGWYDFTVTVSSDLSWSRRYTGHLENGLPSITG